MSDGSGIIGWQKYSFIDFPGTISTVLFFGGCNLRCPYCHNPDIVLNRLPQISLSEITEYLLKRKGAIEGVVFSGGEPTLHSSLPEIISGIRNIGYKVKIDTNGLNPDMVSLCGPDYLAMDLKTSFERYAELGCTLPDAQKRIGHTLQIVKAMGENAEVRITVAPHFTDRDAIEKMAEVLQGVNKVFLQPVQLHIPVIDPEFAGNPQLPEGSIENFRNVIGRFAGSCIIRSETA
ncbi:MAG: anaerobic ribonucleoside-triphosphate reductase activating protein [Fibrobacter sp.]|nr:anaerobic ribonucleoside-triphosphate reductase activating protein [Fibrobacter sp.]